jgi:hypothetical protein
MQNKGGQLQNEGKIKIVFADPSSAGSVATAQCSKRRAKALRIMTFSSKTSKPACTVDVFHWQDRGHQSRVPVTLPQGQPAIIKK